MSRWDPADDAVKDPRPYDFEGAKRAVAHQSGLHAQAMNQLARAARDLGEAERSYRLALASKLLELRSEGTAATLCQDLAKGDEKIANLRFERDIKKGLLDAAHGASIKASVDRRELEQLIDWSMRVSPDGQYVGGTR